MSVNPFESGGSFLHYLILNPKCHADTSTLEKKYEVSAVNKRKESKILLKLK